MTPEDAVDENRELYGALMNGLPDEERDDVVELIIDNIQRLRSDGDSYAP